MTYCPPQAPQTYEFTALTGADLLQGHDTELSCGDSFAMPVSATACITITDNDGTLSGDARRNELGDDRSWQLADIEVDGTLLHDNQKVYAEEYYVLHDQNGNCYYLIEIEIAGSGHTDLDDYYAFYGNVPPAGAQLTVAGKANVCGNWLDYKHLSAGLKWELDADGKLTIEAEEMALSGYKVDDVHAASGGEVIRLKHGTGTASMVFGGESGTYSLDLAYIDESDGEGSIEVWINGTLVHTIDLTSNNNGNGNDWSSISTVHIPDLQVAQGDEIVLKGTQDAWEMARIDALTFFAMTNEPPQANDDSYTLAEDAVVALDLLINDFDPDGDALTIVSVTQPVDGSVSLVDGIVTFDTGGAFAGLSAGQVAEVTFEYTISDGNATDTALVTVTIEGSGEPSRQITSSSFVETSDVTVIFETPEAFGRVSEEETFSISVNIGDVAQERYNFVYTIDVSGSTGVADSFGPGQTVLEAEIEALKALTANVLDLGLENATVTIIPFSSPDAVPGGMFPVFTIGDDETLDQASVDTVLDALTADGETSYLAAIGATTQTLQDLETQFGEANNQVYFLSDGNPTPPGTQPAFLIDFFASTMKGMAEIHAVGLGTEVSLEFLDPLDNTGEIQPGRLGNAEIVTDPAALDTALGQAPDKADVILDANLRFFSEGVLIDSFDFTASDFSSTPLGYQLDVTGISGLSNIEGDTTTAELSMNLDNDGDGLVDESITLSVDIAGLLPESVLL